MSRKKKLQLYKHAYLCLQIRSFTLYQSQAEHFTSHTQLVKKSQLELVVFEYGCKSIPSTKGLCIELAVIFKFIRKSVFLLGTMYTTSMRPMYQLEQKSTCSFHSHSKQRVNPKQDTKFLLLGSLNTRLGTRPRLSNNVHTGTCTS